METVCATLCFCRRGISKGGKKTSRFPIAAFDSHNQSSSPLQFPILLLKNSSKINCSFFYAFPFLFVSPASGFPAILKFGLISWSPTKNQIAAVLFIIYTRLNLKSKIGLSVMSFPSSCIVGCATVRPLRGGEVSWAMNCQKY